MSLADQIKALPKRPTTPVGRDNVDALLDYYEACLAVAREWIDLCQHRPGCMYPCTCGRDELLKALEPPK